MLSSLAATAATTNNSSSSSTSTNYENPSNTWKFNLTPSSCAALVAALVPSTPSNKHQEKSNVTPVFSSFSDDDEDDNNDQQQQLDPLRILLFAESFPSFTSGITRRFKEIIRRLAKKKHQIHVITGCKNAHLWLETDENLRKFVTFSILPSTEFTQKIDCACPFLFPHLAIYSSIRAFAPDIIHIVEQTPAAMFCGALAKSLEIPIVWSSHTNIDFYLSTYIRPYAVKMTRRIYQLIRLKHLIYSTINLTVSQDFADYLERTGIPRPVFVWKTGVDSDLFNPQRRSLSMRYRMFGRKHNFTVDQMNSITLFLCVGRISPEKNFQFVSHLLERISLVDTFLCIVGDGPYRKTLEPLFPSDRVYFLGYLDGEELANAYASADYFIYASISETFGQVYLEAMASGTPVVAAEGGQLKEFFLQGEHGYLWEPENFDSAEKAVRLAMINRDYLSRKAREQALKHSWDSAADQLNEIYYQANRNCSRSINRFYFLGRFIYYGFQWFICILLALILMAPFVQVSSPNEQKYCSTIDRIENQSKKKHSDQTGA